MDVNQKSELIGSWTPTSKKKKCVDPSSGKSGSKTSTAGTIGSSFFCCCFSLKFVFIPLTDSALSSDADWQKQNQNSYHSDQKWGSEVKFTESESWREAEFLRWLIKEIFKQKDSWTVFTVYKQEILKHPDLKRQKLAALWRVQGGASSDQGHSYCQPWGLKQGSWGTLTSLFSCPWMTYQ